jgi:hypothetical protein
MVTGVLAQSPAVHKRQQCHLSIKASVKSNKNRTRSLRLNAISTEGFLMTFRKKDGKADSKK